MKFFLVLVLVLSTGAFAKPGRHFCRPSTTDIPCQLELALVCGEGYIDGCLTQQTDTHRCILKNEGESCSTDLEILCPEHFRDGCELGRTTRHQCVPVSGPSCAVESFDCPEGFTDSCGG